MDVQVTLFRGVTNGPLAAAEPHHMCYSSMVLLEAVLTGRPVREVGLQIYDALVRYFELDDQNIRQIRRYWKSRGMLYFARRAFLFQQRYSSSDCGFSEDASNQLEAQRQWSWAFPFQVFRTTLHFNPHLSTSKDVRHAINYALGLKSYANVQPTFPEYDANGRPRNQILGKLALFQLTQAQIDNQHAKDVERLHEQQQLQINPRILPEKEVTFYSYIPEEHMLACFVITPPDLSVPANDLLLIGISERKRAEHVRNLARFQDDAENRVKLEKKIIESLSEFLVKFVGNWLVNRETPLPPWLRREYLVA